jgi:hypothetical protein
MGYVYLLHWAESFIEKLTSSELFKKIPPPPATVYGTRKFITKLTGAHHLSLSWALSL